LRREEIVQIIYFGKVTEVENWKQVVNHENTKQVTYLITKFV